MRVILPSRESDGDGGGSRRLTNSLLTALLPYVMFDLKVMEACLHSLVVSVEVVPGGSLIVTWGTKLFHCFQEPASIIAS